ncbi:ricin B lectin domain-containing protein [Phanerochaete sordida]|uniref:Ricin B lectin domain-containing protein n=1 Tax=Phanerochaete sordida TaxID=48140 RepID=A0A9P3G4Z7_9APHY|nr:ricin B lectin domain-containing protein [Phanerochaete sordida]
MSAQPLEEGVYFIQNVATGTCLDLTDVKAVSKTDITGCWVPTQLWIISFNPDRNEDTYHIENSTGRTFMELKEGTGNVMCNGLKQDTDANNHQWWNIVRNDKTTAYVIQNEKLETYVELKDGYVSLQSSAIASIMC